MPANARIDRLFVKFSAIYGHIWQSQFKQADFLNIAKKIWSETLAEISDENIDLALKACTKRHEMPPTLPMFYQLCRSYQPKIKVAEVVKKECKPANEKNVETHLKKLREIVSQSLFKTNAR